MLEAAIQNLWLAARAEGIGMGWVSMYDPKAVAEMLNMPSGSKPIAVLCLGHVEAFYPAPMLELQGSADILQPGPAALTDGLAQIRRIIERWAEETRP